MKNKIKKELKWILIFTFRTTISLLMIFTGLWLCINFFEKDMIFGVGLIWNMLGGYLFFKTVLEYKLKEIKYKHSQPCDCDICYNQKEILKQL